MSRRRRRRRFIGLAKTGVTHIYNVFSSSRFDNDARGER